MRTHILEGTSAEGRKWTGCGRLVTQDARTVGRAVLVGREHEVTCGSCKARYGLTGPREVWLHVDDFDAMVWAYERRGWKRCADDLIVRSRPFVDLQLGQHRRRLMVQP